LGIWSNLFNGPGVVEVRDAPALAPTEWDPPAPLVNRPENRAAMTGLGNIVPSSWPGWPGDWGDPQWEGARPFAGLVDTAWACLDLNSSVLSTMPVYRLQSGRIVNPTSWMVNPDPEMYASWSEFASELFWDFMLGEAFVFAAEYDFNNRPSRMRVVPPWIVQPEWQDGLVGSKRRYRIGGLDVTDQILHIRYHSRMDTLRGIGPLELSGARMVAASVLQRFVAEVANTGGRPIYWIENPRRLNKTEADDLLDQWVESRSRNLGKPAVMSGGATLGHMEVPNAKDMALVELSQFTESRIAVMLGVPPFLAGLPSGGDSMTYSNVSSLFDFHDRASLRPKATRVMSALSNWALPRGTNIEMNRDDYTRPDPKTRSEYYVNLHGIGAIDKTEVRTMERLHGDAAAGALTGGTDA
jgi:HK97 family phage portal protein